MDVRTAWDTLAQAIAQMQDPEGEAALKLDTVRAGVELLFEFPPEQVLEQVERSALPTRATVSWLVFEGSRLPGVAKAAVQDLRRMYEATCPPGQGIIQAPPGLGGRAGTA